MIAINKTVQDLMLAMAEHEGWFPHNQESGKEGSRSYRNHNPGNLRSSIFESGKREGFAYFNSDIIGFMALQYDLMQKAKGNTVTKLGPKSTLKDLIYVWAPPSDNNDTEKYINTISIKTGIKPETTLQEIFDL